MLIGNRHTHPAADIFPMLDDDAHAGLLADVREHGLIEPIVIDKESGLIVDGRNRARVCVDLKIEPKEQEIEFGDDEQVAVYVISRNVHRRHMTPSQLGVVATKIATLPVGRPKMDTNVHLTQAVAAKLLNVSTGTIKKARALVDTGRDDLVAQVANGDKSLNRATKEAARDASAKVLRDKPPPPPVGPFDVVVLDPPWAYAKNAIGGDRRGDVDYPDMTEGEIIALDISRHLSGDAVVWMWTTNAHMESALRILRAWGLQPKTILTWAKNRIGTGDWLRGATEHCILATFGVPTVTLTNQSTLLIADVREHSRKPDEFFALVESLCPGSKCEWFAREARPGWTSHGVDLGKFQNATVTWIPREKTA